ncbi:uncharacterized protein LOC121834043, partial [Ixodes scapularis]|uniref:uncharacterized protein LOC121834043 n=1 Tax=Ixodes scapularis TaxID=6945 RepID=UPI001C38D2C4
MCRNISNMLLVLFAVVLILPAFQGVGFLSGSRHMNLFHCGNAVGPAVKILCELSGSNTSSLSSCNVTCIDPKQTLRMPHDV